jgi:hypothetical protein
MRNKDEGEYLCMFRLPNRITAFSADLTEIEEAVETFVGRLNYPLTIVASHLSDEQKQRTSRIAKGDAVFKGIEEARDYVFGIENDSR